MVPRRFISDAADWPTRIILATALGPPSSMMSSATVIMASIYTYRVDDVNMIYVNMICDNPDMEEMHERLRWAREQAGFPSARAAAMKFTWQVSTYAAHENGQNRFDGEAAKKYGKAYKVSAGWLLTGDGPKEQKNILPVMGFIGAGAEIMPEYEQVPPEGLFEIEAPFPIPDDAIAFEVQGDSMWPRYDPGDVVVCWKFSSSIDEVVGWEAAVMVDDGRRFLKRIVLGATPRTYDLESYNAPPIRGVHISWVGQVNAVIRATDWRANNRRARQKALDALKARIA